MSTELLWKWIDVLIATIRELRQNQRKLEKRLAQSELRSAAIERHLRRIEKRINELEAQEAGR